MTNFTNTDNPKGTSMNREQAKTAAKSKAGIFATLSNLFRAKGTSAPPSPANPPSSSVRPRTARRTPIALVTGLIAIAALFATTASASAAPPTVTTPVVSDISYTSVHLTGKITTDGSAFTNTYVFQYSTDEVTWSSSPTGFVGKELTDREVEADLSDLKSTTKYFVRLVAQSGFSIPDPQNPEATSPLPNPSFTTLAVDPPTIPGTVEASPVFSTSATAKGTVKRPANPADPKPGADAAFDVNCHFDYITDASYQDNVTNIGPEAGFTGATPVPCAQNPIKEADAGIEKDVDADFAPGTLTPSTTYHLRLVAENAAPGGPVVKVGANFTTAPKVAAPSVTVVNDASEVKFNTATLTGEILRPDGPDPALNVNCHFEYVTDAAFQPLSEQQKLTLTNATGGTFTLSFAGETTAPIAFDASAADVQSALESLGAIGAGNVSVSGSYTIDFTGSLADKDVEQIFADPSALEEAGVATAETAIVAEGHVGGFESPQTANCVEKSIKTAGETEVSAKAGTVATTKYHYRLVAENEGGSDTKDALNTFTTPEAELPTVTIDPVEGGTFTTAHVTGTAIPDVPGRCVIPFVEKSTDNVNWDIFEAPSCGIAGTEPKHDYTALSPSTTYFFRICATYSGFPYDQALANGEVACSPEPNPEITTEAPQAPPTAENLAVTDITATSAHFSGTVNPNAPAGPLSGPAKKAYETKWHFECAPECTDQNGNEIGGTVQGEEGPQTVTGDVKRLEPGTDYTVSLVVSSGIPGEPAVETFPTDKSPPSVKQFPGSSDGTGGYTLQGVVNPNKETITDCKFKWGPSSNDLVFSADCSPMPIPGVKPTTVEAHLTGLTADVDYYSQLVVTYGGGLEKDSGDPQAFKATLAVKEPCPANEQLRIENSSLALPECRAYEMVTPAGKEGFGASFAMVLDRGTYDGGNRVAYISGATNIAKSGQGSNRNAYVAARTAAGWQTIPNLNGPSGSFRDAPSNVDSNVSKTFIVARSPDLRSTLWALHRQGNPGDSELMNLNLRDPNGTFTRVGSALTVPGGNLSAPVAASADLSHAITWQSEWGLGVYEYVGTGMDQPRRVDLDNSGSPISGCPVGIFPPVAEGRTISADGRTVVFRVGGGCGGANPPANEIWARVNGTTAVDVSASHCTRLDCNAPADPTFVAATPDGSRVFFTTTQQLVDEDTDQTNDIYACDLPTGNPAPTADKANHCAAFRQVSAGDPTGAAVESVGTTSENGATVLFTAKGKLADNEDALKEKAVPGDHNLYVWRADASHPDGQTAFLGRLETNDVGASAQATPDGRYLVFTTANQLVSTDTDTADDVYRYDVDAEDLTRVSTNVFGVAGNGDSDAQISGPAEHNPTTAISDDGTKIVFTTTEPLKPAVDNNDEADVYLWTPDRVSLISTGAVRAGGNGAYVTASGEDIYFGTAGALTPADPGAESDIYDARVGGGFSFPQATPCSGAGGACQSHAPASAPFPAPATAQPPADPGNVKPKTCPKGKVLKGKKCVKKNKHKKHHGKKKSHKKNKRTASHGRGGNK